MSWLDQYIYKHKSKFVHITNYKICRILTDPVFLKISYRIRFGKNLNLKNPETFNEKIQWMKLYDRRPEYSKLADKFAVKSYVAKMIGEEYIVPLYGAYDRYEDIDFEQLPDQFVLKPNHTSGDVFICADKSKIDHALLRKEVSRWLKREYYWVNREWPYIYIKPKIICEKYIINKTDADLKDYKFMCFHGKVRFCVVCSNRKSPDGLNMDYYDMDWQHLPIMHAWPNSGGQIVRPVNYDKMVEIARILSKDLPFVRVDLYETEERPYFGELTLYPGSGYGEFKPETYDYLLGSWIDLGIKENTPADCGAMS
jgi:hypothetical protein